jgi:hypothetical protein
MGETDFQQNKKIQEDITVSGYDYELYEGKI